MATRACRSAHLAAVDTLAEQQPFLALRLPEPEDWKCCLPASGCVPSGGCAAASTTGSPAGAACAWARSDVRRASFGAALINNTVDSPAHIVGNVKRTVRSDRQASGAMVGFIGRFHCPRKTIGKYFALPGGAAARRAAEKQRCNHLAHRAPDSMSHGRR